MFGNTSSDFLLRLFLTIAIFGVEALQLAGQVVPVHPGSAEGAPGKNGITLQPFNFCPKCRGWSPRGMPVDWVDRNPFLLKSWGTYQSKISLTESKRIPNLKSENWTAWTIFKKIGFPKHGIVFQTFFHIFPYFSRIFPEFFQIFPNHGHLWEIWQLPGIRWGEPHGASRFPGVDGYHAAGRKSWPCFFLIGGNFYWCLYIWGNDVQISMDWFKGKFTGNLHI